MDQQTYSFRLSGLGGEVVVQYGPNTDPVRWGYELLGLDFPSSAAKGFPVLRADVTYDGEGYAATLGWLQAVWMTVAAEREPRTIVDVPPQLIASGFPTSPSVSSRRCSTLLQRPVPTLIGWLGRFLQRLPID
jgi:hypothetical protein